MAKTANKTEEPLEKRNLPQAAAGLCRSVGTRAGMGPRWLDQ